MYNNIFFSKFYANEDLRLYKIIGVIGWTGQRMNSFPLLFSFLLSLLFFAPFRSLGFPVPSFLASCYRRLARLLAAPDCPVLRLPLLCQDSLLVEGRVVVAKDGQERLTLCHSSTGGVHRSQIIVEYICI
jgi:hypothetical protein